MSTAPTTAELVASGREFAHAAVEAHRDRRARRTAIDAGTALEHLAKAVLVQRSPALIADLKRGDHLSLIRLLSIPGARTKPGQRAALRTVGLRDAITRAELFVPHTAYADDVATLIDLRDGVVHAGNDTEVALRLMVAFATVADAFLQDLAIPRARFWQLHLDSIDSLLSDALDQVASEVAFAMAAARAKFEAAYQDLPESVRTQLMGARTPRVIEADEDIIACPVCKQLGVATGLQEVEWSALPDYVDEDTARYQGEVNFAASSFHCVICGLALSSEAHMKVAGMATSWIMDGVDPYDFDPDGPQWWDHSNYQDLLDEARAAEADYEAQHSADGNSEPER